MYMYFIICKKYCTHITYNLSSSTDIRLHGQPIKYLYSCKCYVDRLGQITI